MKGYYLVCTVIIWILLTIDLSRAQEIVLPDSLKTEILSTMTPDKQCEFMVDYYMKCPPENRDTVFSLIGEVSYRHGLYKCLYKAHRNKAIFAFGQHKMEEAKQAFLNNIKYAELANDTLEYAIATGNCAYVYSLMEKVDSAIIMFTISLQHYEISDNLPLSGNTVLNFASLYHMIGLYDDAIEINNKALEIYESTRDSSGMSYVFNNLGIIYIDLNKSEQGREMFKIAHQLKMKHGDERDLVRSWINISTSFSPSEMLDSVNFYLDKATDLAIQIKDTIELAAIYNIRGLVALQNGKNRDAIAYLERARELRNNYDIKTYHTQSAVRLTLALARDNQVKKAQQLAFDLIPFLKENRLNRYLADLHYDLCHMYIRNAVKDSAAYHLEQYIAYKDSISRDNFDNAAGAYIAKLNLKDKEQQIALQQIKLDYVQSMRKRQIIIFASLLLILIVVALFIIQRLKYRKSILEKEKLQLENQKEIETLNIILSAQEEERMRIGKDLHDSVGSMLASVKVHMQALARSFKDLAVSDVFNKTKYMLDHAYDEVRHTSHQMMPEALKRLGLTAAITDIAEWNASNMLSVDFLIDENAVSRLNEQQSLYIYRIIQELVQNTVKHAEAETIFIKLSNEENGVKILVTDDGNGWDSRRETDGIGLKSIKSRIDYLKGEIKIDTIPGEGSTFIIFLPDLVLTQTVSTSSVAI